ncbi:MAG: hypothetical protein QNJ97_17880 [Myxococcota bacterium]|nr:hypothetical protein [Myxococcota bacterium]
MAVNSKFTTLLEEHGLRSQESILRERTQDAIRSTLSGLAQTSLKPSERSAARAGGILGAALGARLRKLSPEQEQNAKIAQEAQDAFDRFERTTETSPSVAGTVFNPQTQEFESVSGPAQEFTFEGDDPRVFLSDEDNLFEFERQLAIAAMKNGRPDLAASIEQKRVQKLIQLGLAQAELDRESSPGGAPADQVKLMNNLIQSSERRELATKARSVQAQSAIMQTFGDLIEESGAEAGDFGAFLDTSGNLSSGFVKLRNAVRGVGAAFGAFLVGDPEAGEQTFGSSAELRSSQRFGNLVDAIKVPPQIADNAVRSNQYKALIVDLAYATARSNENAGGRLSNDDYENALKQLGARSGDPRSLLSILSRNLQGKLADLEFSVDSFEGRAEGILPEGFVSQRILGLPLEAIMAPATDVNRRFGGLLEEIEARENQAAFEAEGRRNVERADRELRRAGFRPIPDTPSSAPATPTDRPPADQAEVVDPDRLRTLQERLDALDQN